MIKKTINLLRICVSILPSFFASLSSPIFIRLVEPREHFIKYHVEMQLSRLVIELTLSYFKYVLRDRVFDMMQQKKF